MTKSASRSLTRRSPSRRHKNNLNELEMAENGGAVNGTNQISVANQARNLVPGDLEKMGAREVGALKGVFVNEIGKNQTYVSELQTEVGGLSSEFKQVQKTRVAATDALGAARDEFKIAQGKYDDALTVHGTAMKGCDARTSSLVKDHQKMAATIAKVSSESVVIQGALGKIESFILERAGRFSDAEAKRLAAELKSKTDALEAAEKSLAAANQKKQDEEAKAKAREEMMKRKRAEAEAKIAAEMAAWDAQN